MKIQANYAINEMDNEKSLTILNEWKFIIEIKIKSVIKNSYPSLMILKKSYKWIIKYQLKK